MEPQSHLYISGLPAYLTEEQVVGYCCYICGGEASGSVLEMVLSLLHPRGCCAVVCVCNAPDARSTTRNKLVLVFNGSVVPQVQDVLEVHGRVKMLRLLPKTPGQNLISAYCLYTHAASTANALKELPKIKVRQAMNHLERDVGRF